MPARLIPAQVSRSRQPPKALAPDWGNPITRGLTLLWNGADAANRNVALSDAATASGSGIATSAYPQGLGRTFDASANYLTWPSGNTSTNHDFTIFLVVRNHSGSGTAQRMFHVGDRTGTNGGVFNVDDGGSSRLRYTKLAVAAIGSTVPCPQNVPCMVALTYNATSGDLVFTARNLLTGVVSTNTANNNAAHAGNSGDIGLSHSAGESANGAFFMSAFWWRTLASSEVAALLDAPWQLFEPRKLMMPRAVSSAFRPAWALGRSGMIGAR